MKVKIFDDVEKLNEYLKVAKGKVEILFQSQIAGQNIDASGRKTFEMIDRFLVIER